MFSSAMVHDVRRRHPAGMGAVLRPHVEPRSCIAGWRRRRPAGSPCRSPERDGVVAG
ncbi:hypothetical protein CLJ1_2838 [Pseudomonas paraeruginosa]|nr:hypothetical protein CLJ1_2838 [Pseudomonas aeruginosa]